MGKNTDIGIKSNVAFYNFNAELNFFIIVAFY